MAGSGQVQEGGKCWARCCGPTLNAAEIYRLTYQLSQQNQGSLRKLDAPNESSRSRPPLQLWDRKQLVKRWERLPEYPPNVPQVRQYQEADRRGRPAIQEPGSHSWSSWPPVWADICSRRKRSGDSMKLSAYHYGSSCLRTGTNLYTS